MDESVIKFVLTRSPRLEKGMIKQYPRMRLQLFDMVYIFHLFDDGVGCTELFSKFKTSPCSIYRLNANIGKVITMDKNRLIFIVRRYVHANHTVIENLS